MDAGFSKLSHEEIPPTPTAPPAKKKKKSSLNGLEVMFATGYLDFEQDIKVKNSYMNPIHKEAGIA